MDTTPVSSLLRTLALALALAALLATPALARTSAPQAAADSTVEACSWDRPGVDPFMGDVVAAVDGYQDIPADVRQRLKARMVKRDYDDIVSIRRDSITGQARARYGKTIRDMHFGQRKLCRTVSRAAWSPQMQERGLVYCESGQCILVPTVCRNVSRIARAEVAHGHAEGEGPDLLAVPVATVDLLPPAPVPVDVSPLVLALDAGPGFETAGGYGQGGGAGGGGNGSFVAGAGAGGGVGLATIAANPGRGDSSVPESPPISGPTISPVPEPETWAAMLAGLAALAAATRRRRRAA